MKTIQILRTLSISAVVIAWVALSWFGCSSPLCRLINISPEGQFGFATYNVNQIDEYIDYVEGADLYQIHGVTTLSFACEDLRDQLADEMNQYFKENVFLGGVAHVQTMLMLSDNGRGDEESLEEWRQTIEEFIQRARRQDPELPITWGAIVRLFDEIYLHNIRYSAEVKWDPYGEC